MKKGIFLIATNHPYFGRMAYNLALTLKAAEPGMPIAIMHDDAGLKHLTADQIKIFDKRIPCKKGKNLKGINELRMSMPAITPFEETLCLDVDMVWIGEKPSKVFELLNNRDFTIVNEGFVDLDTDADETTKLYTHWADYKAIREAYGLKGKLYQVRGEFVLLRKGKAVSDLYKQAKAIQTKPLLEPSLLANSVTDEFALNIAMSLSGMEPHESGWQPAYWMNRHNNMLPYLHELNKNYFALSLGGNYILPPLKTMHDLVVQGACSKLGVPFQFSVQPKRHFLTERLQS